MLDRMDAELEQIYLEAGFRGVRARFILPLVRLSRLGPASIKALAAECGVTHSGMSQTVAAMRSAGLVETVPDPADGRGKLVSLTPAAEPVVALGEAEWAATEAAVAELEAESAHALSAVVADLEARLAQRSFGERVRAHLDDAR
jgi:DNA-binding MarR family transcriptional regulator